MEEIRITPNKRYKLIIEDENGRIGEQIIYIPEQSFTFTKKGNGFELSNIQIVQEKQSRFFERMKQEALKK